VHWQGIYRRNAYGTNAVDIDDLTSCTHKVRDELPKMAMHIEVVLANLNARKGNRSAGLKRKPYHPSRQSFARGQVERRGSHEPGTCMARAPPLPSPCLQLQASRSSSTARVGSAGSVASIGGPPGASECRWARGYVLLRGNEVSVGARRQAAGLDDYCGRGRLLT
jgi:hypothetical protein